MGGARILSKKPDPAESIASSGPGDRNTLLPCSPFRTGRRTRFPVHPIGPPAIAYRRRPGDSEQDMDIQFDGLNSTKT